MGQRRRRLNPLKAVPLERQRAKERRADRQRVYRRADIVNITGQGKFSRTHAAAENRSRLIDNYRASRLRQGNRRRQAVRAGADDDGIVAIGHL